jgi:hypothetical protein
MNSADKYHKKKFQLAEQTDMPFEEIYEFFASEKD